MDAFRWYNSGSWCCCLVVAETFALAELLRVDDVGVATADLREQEGETSAGDTAAEED